MQGWHCDEGLIYLMANISANKISLPQGQSCTEGKCYNRAKTSSSQRENKRINMKTKGKYIYIYIFRVAMFLKTGVYIYIYIFIKNWTRYIGFLAF